VSRYIYVSEEYYGSEGVDDSISYSLCLVGYSLYIFCNLRQKEKIGFRIVVTLPRPIINHGSRFYGETEVHAAPINDTIGNIKS
jgi:hypothetical protein